MANDSSQEVPVWIREYEAARTQGDFQGALEIVNSAIEVVRDLGKRNELTAAILVARGICQSDLASSEEAERSFQEALEIYSGIEGVDLERSLCLMERAMAQLAQDEVELARAGLNEAKHFFDAAQDGTEKAVFLQNYSRLLQAEGKLEEAERSAAEANDIQFKLAGNAKQAAGALIQSANVYRDSGNTAAAEADYKKAAELAVTADSPHPELMRSWLGLGNICLDRGELAEGVAWIERAMAAKESGTGMDLALGRMNLGAALLRQSKSTDAIPHLQEALSYMSENADGAALTPDCESNLGMAFTESGDALQGIYHAKRALQAFKGRPRSQSKQAMCLLVLAANHDRMGDVAACTRAARESLSLAELSPASPFNAHVIGECKKLLRKHDASNAEELSGEQFVARLNSDPDFRADFRAAPLKLAEDHGLTIGDILMIATSFTAIDESDQLALLALLEAVAGTSNRQ